jgi:nitrogen fixation protein NifX
MMTLERRLKILHSAVTEAETAQPEQSLALNVAFATSDLKTVDQHFGTATNFAIYHINMTHHHCLEVVQFASSIQNGHDNKLPPKLRAVQGCVLMYCEAIGASAVMQLRKQGTQAMKVPVGTTIKDLVQLLQQELHDGPSPWLKHMLTRQSSDTNKARFDVLEAEGWCE